MLAVFFSYSELFSMFSLVLLFFLFFFFYMDASPHFFFNFRAYYCSIFVMLKALQ